MVLKMKLDLNRFEKDINEGFIVRREHPTHPICIYNYTQKAMYENHWTEETKLCRGLVLDFEGNIVANPFPKFFNYLQQTDDKPFEFPNESFEVTSKVDGMLALIFFYQNELIFATRGCFDSEYVDEIQFIFNMKYGNLRLDTTKTYLAELISPLSKIVLDYHGVRDLILIAVRDTETGRELNYEEMCYLYQTWTKVKRYEGLDLESILKMDVPNEEGFVLLFESGMRMKIKFPEYVRLHAIISHLSSKTVWSYLKDCYPLDELFDSVPDEIVLFVKKWAAKLDTEFQKVKRDCDAMFQKVKGLSTRKEQALAIKEYQYKPAIFAMLDGKNYAKIIWEWVEPEREVPYEVNDEN